MSEHWCGVFRGICTNNNDPGAAHRIKAIIPQVFGNGVTESNWASPCFPPGWTSNLLIAHPSATLSGSDSHGDTVSVNLPSESHTLDLLVPNTGDGVWIMFEGGDVDYPVWMGGWK